jgi:hypothetical protein
MKKAKDILEKKKSKCAVCYGEYLYFPAWPYGDTCSNKCFYNDTRTHGCTWDKPKKAKGPIPTKKSIIDI